MGLLQGKARGEAHQRTRPVGDAYHTAQRHEEINLEHWYNDDWQERTEPVE
jgi:hypothetical protein